MQRICYLHVLFAFPSENSKTILVFVKIGIRVDNESGSEICAKIRK